jgi:hypothetical protein
MSFYSLWPRSRFHTTKTQSGHQLEVSGGVFSGESNAKFSNTWRSSKPHTIVRQSCALATAKLGAGETQTLNNCFTIFVWHPPLVPQATLPPATQLAYALKRAFTYRHLRTYQTLTLDLDHQRVSGHKYGLAPVATATGCTSADIAHRQADLGCTAG